MPSTLQSPLAGTLKATQSVVSSKDMRGEDSTIPILTKHSLVLGKVQAQMQQVETGQEELNKSLGILNDRLAFSELLRKRREREEEDRLRREEVEAARAAAEKNLEGGAAAPMKKVIMAPVRKVQNTMRGLLDKVLGFMGWLFGGAIFNSLLDMWNGIREGDWDLMKKASTALKGVLATLSAGLTGLNSIWKLITKGIGKAITSVGNFIKNIARGLVNKITGGRGLFGFGKTVKPPKVNIPKSSTLQNQLLNKNLTKNKVNLDKVVNLKSSKIVAPSGGAPTIPKANVGSTLTTATKGKGLFSGIKNLMPLASKVLTVLGGFLDFMDGDWVDLGVLLISGIAGIVAASAAAPVVATVAGIVAAIAGIVYTYEKIAEMLKGWGINFLPDILPEAGVIMWNALGKKDDDPSTRAAWDFLGWAGTGKKKEENKVDGDNVSSIKNNTADSVGEDPSKDDIEIVYVPFGGENGATASNGGKDTDVADNTPSISAENNNNLYAVSAKVQSGVLGA